MNTSLRFESRRGSSGRRVGMSKIVYVPSWNSTNKLGTESLTAELTQHGDVLAFASESLKDDRPAMLGVGSHEVTIKEAKVEANAGKGTHQLVVSYANDDGQIRQWIYLNHPQLSTSKHLRLWMKLLRGWLMFLT